MPQQQMDFEFERPLTVNEVAEALGLSVALIRTWILRREIPVLRVSRHAVRIPRAAVREILDRSLRPALPKTQAG